jgi:hypothetical protein
MQQGILNNDVHRGVHRRLQANSGLLQALGIGAAAYGFKVDLGELEFRHCQGRDCPLVNRALHNLLETVW